MALVAFVVDRLGSDQSLGAGAVGLGYVLATAFTSVALDVTGVAAAALLFAAMSGCLSETAAPAEIVLPSRSGGSDDAGSGFWLGAPVDVVIPPNHAPSLSLDADIVSGSVPLEVSFTVDGEDPDGDPVPYRTLRSLFEDVEASVVDHGAVPVENSTEGPVAHTLDLLVASPLRICAEISLPVRHNLLARRGTTLADVRRVVAHPQAHPAVIRGRRHHDPAVRLAVLGGVGA